MDDSSKSFSDLLEKIENKTAIIAFVGVGYVGKALGDCIVEEGYKAIGFDKDKARIRALKQDKAANPNFSASDDYQQLKNCDIIFITVPTPIDENKKPDLSAVIQASEVVSQHLRPGQLVILESTVAPGTTRDVMLPILEKSKLKFGQDFFIGFSPDRIDFGNPDYNVKNTPKIVSGLDDKSRQLILAFYPKVLKTIVPVSTVEGAELCKILENTFRFVNINLINEFSEYAVKKNIDIFEVIKAAATKPFGFMPFYPGGGIAGHCIPVDPYYLTEDAGKLGVPFEIVKQAMIFHGQRLEKIADTALEILRVQKPKKATKYKILIIGVSVKPDSVDSRESVGEKLWDLLEKKGAEVLYHDPYVPEMEGIKSTPLNPHLLHEIDLVMILTEHSKIDYKLILAAGKPIIDTKGVYKEEKNHVYRV